MHCCTLWFARYLTAAFMHTIFVSTFVCTHVSDNLLSTFHLVHFYMLKILVVTLFDLQSIWHLLPVRTSTPIWPCFTHMRKILVAYTHCYTLWFAWRKRGPICSVNKEDRAFFIHTSSPISEWGFHQRSNKLLQETGIPSGWQVGSAFLQHNDEL